MNVTTGDIVQLIQLRVPGVFCHQVNCQRVAGAGLAAQFARTFPGWKRTFQAREPRLGEVALYDTGYGNRIADLYAQLSIATAAAPQATNLSALTDCLHIVTTHATHLGVPLYLPWRIGCGLGGGDWNRVSAIIERVAPDAILVKLPQAQPSYSQQLTERHRMMNLD